MNAILSGRPPGVPRVLCLGETMVMLTPQEAASLAEPGTALTMQVGGAESNVAMGLSQLGCPAAWWSRLGADPLGSLIRTAVEKHGVEVHAPADPERRTGIYFKDIGPEGTEVIYFRDGSAASAMSPSDLSSLPPWTALLHLSGITPALSEGAAALIQRLLEQPRTDGRRVSFDVNHRPQLWKSDDDAATRLRSLADSADIVFVGLDEAHRLWGTETAGEIRSLFPQVPELVVKDGPREATTFIGEEATTAPAHSAEVVELVGAGDAFAAGYLASTLAGRSPEDRLRAGHLCAREAIQATTDVPVLPPLEELLSMGLPHQPPPSPEGSAI